VRRPKWAASLGGQIWPTESLERGIDGALHLVAPVLVLAKRATSLVCAWLDQRRGHNNRAGRFIRARVLGPKLAGRGLECGSRAGKQLDARGGWGCDWRRKWASERREGGGDVNRMELAFHFAPRRREMKAARVSGRQRGSSSARSPHEHLEAGAAERKGTNK